MNKSLINLLFVFFMFFKDVYSFKTFCISTFSLQFVPQVALLKASCLSEIIGHIGPPGIRLVLGC